MVSPGHAIPEPMSLHCGVRPTADPAEVHARRAHLTAAGLEVSPVQTNARGVPVLLPRPERAAGRGQRPDARADRRARRQSRLRSANRWALM